MTGAIGIARLRIRLIDDWQKVLARAWSVRLIAVAALLSGAETAFTLVEDRLDVPPAALAGLAFLFTAGALIARILAQRDLEAGHGGQ